LALEARIDKVALHIARAHSAYFAASFPRVLGDRRKGGHLMPQKSKSSHELIDSLKGYLDENDEAERAVASRIAYPTRKVKGRGKRALVAFFSTGA
jgi:hypothetical protein